jgi:isopenicillin N synthase-like dioxygenase
VWEKVPLVPGSYIVNIGDMLKRWTNDKWESSLHRVGNPPFDPALDSRRQSIVFFFHPNHDVVIEPLPGCDAEAPKYPPIGAGELLVSRLDKIRSGGSTY